MLRSKASLGGVVGCVVGCVIVLIGCGSDQPDDRVAPTTTSTTTTSTTTSTTTATSTSTTPSTTGPIGDGLRLDAIDEETAGMLASLTDADIESVGGLECAQELAVLSVGYDWYLGDMGAPPDDFGVLVDAGYLRQQPTLWELNGDDLLGAAGSPCSLESAEMESICSTEYATIEVASEAYVALKGAPASLEQDLIDADLIRTPIANWDLAADGGIVLADGSECLVDETGAPVTTP